MAGNEDYEEFEAVVRIPRGERLVDSKENEGWNLGFTPKSTDKGPEFAKIRIKDDGEDSMPVEPQFIYIDEFGVAHQKSPEEREAEALAAALIIIGLIKAAEWAQPRLRRIWEDRVVPFINTPRVHWQQRKAQRRAGGQVAVGFPENVLEGTPVEGPSAAGDAIDAYKANMTSDEARRHFAEALIAQRFAEEKMRMLAEARIEDDAEMRELARVVKSLSPKQVEKVLDSVLASNPALIGDLGKLIKSTDDAGGMKLGSGQMKAALKLTNGRLN